MEKNGGKIIVTTHCDVVWKAAKIKLRRMERNKEYRGNLDNLVCVAIVLRSVMPRVKDRKTKFYFTTEEETTMAGAEAVMHREGRALYIPVDVTTASKKADVNVEWVHNIDRRTLKKVIGRIPKIKVGYRNGHHDETLVFGKKYPTFSLNLPIDGSVHGKSKVSFYKARRFGKAVAEILMRLRKNYDEVCGINKKKTRKSQRK